jgi:hypothetical protein
VIELGPGKFLETLTAKSLTDVDECQTKMQLKPMRVARSSLYALGLSDEARAVTGVEMIADLDETIARSMARGENPCVAVNPEGSYVVPYCDAGKASDRPPNEYSGPSGFGRQTRLELD